MQLVSKHIIDRNHWLYKQLDNLCFLSKNIFNYANYPIRQKFISSGEYLDYYKIQKICQGKTDYLALPAKVSQQVLLRLHESWKSFFADTKEYNIHPDIATAKVLLVIERSRNVHFDPSTTRAGDATLSDQKYPNHLGDCYKFKARPKIPRYKHKTLGRNVLTYTAQAISKAWLKKGIINLSLTDIFLRIKVSQVNQVRIVPKTYHYSMEVVYEPKDVTQSSSGVEGIAGIDIGLNNLATITSNQKGFLPLIINGKPLKSINTLTKRKQTCSPT